MWFGAKIAKNGIGCRVSGIGHSHEPKEFFGLLKEKFEVRMMRFQFRIVE